MDEQEKRLEESEVSAGLQHFRDHLAKQDEPLSSGGYVTGEDHKKLRLQRALLLTDIYEEQARREREMQIARELAEGGSGKHLSDYQRLKRQLKLDD